MRPWRWIVKFLTGLRTGLQTTPKVSARGDLRALTITSRAARLGRVAKSERISTEELEDALRLLADDYPLTFLEVLEVVESVGLAGARARIEAMSRGDL